MKRLACVLLMATVALRLSDVAAQPAPHGPTEVHFEIGPPLPALPDDYETWSRQRRAEFRLKSMDVDGLFKEMTEWLSTPDAGSAIQWAGTTLMSENAAPTLGWIMGSIYERNARVPGRSEHDQTGSLWRAAIYRLATLAIVTVDAEACADQSASQESVRNALNSSKSSILWLKSAKPELRASALDRAEKGEAGSWGKRHIDLLLCWGSRDALDQTDLSQQRERGEQSVNGRVVRDVYLPTKPGWTPPLSPNADAARAAVHARVWQVLAKLIEP